MTRVSFAGASATFLDRLASGARSGAASPRRCGALPVALTTVLLG
ncbi:hypothetical protein ACIBIZ_34230 [Nonomuraea spiralis]|nr:hypothetical protein [Nonomuraea sp. WAC 01424]